MSKETHVSELITEVNRLAAKCDRKTKSIAELEAKRDFATDHRNTALDKVKKVLAENERLRAAVAQQAEDDGLWFIAETAPEAYLQNALRYLHALIEQDTQALQALKEHDIGADNARQNEYMRKHQDEPNIDTGED